MSYKLRFCRHQDFVLTLVLKEKYEDKLYDLYTVCKVVDGKKIPLYDETFTPVQARNFYKYPKKEVYSLDVDE